MIGHIPRKLSAACSLFLRLGGTMNCEITDGHRQYSADLPQGGLEIPCKFVFPPLFLTVKKSQRYRVAFSLRLQTFTMPCCANLYDYNA